MPLSPHAVDITLPQDLATEFAEVATKSVPVRSTLATLLADGATWATVTITFLQGPPAAGYWVKVVSSWLQRKRHDGVGEVTIKGPNGQATFKITAETDLGELAGALHKALFQKPSPPPRDFDDLAI